ncbi:RNA-dependent RNA polymerase 1-like isoform X1 [Stegodyphus dumicola]|uniref:RNA-dependent RNA polymerase 1-like isoform X1 n=1 Tax=Stegodyphus dumicola TaxID=202533 RepID=UPI0015B3043A|nr:RNA-dependent RNA polymerase 1-like isoform X1 [Stegodyphus dumicola]
MFIKDFVPNTELTKEDTNNKSLYKFQKENAMFHQEYLYNIYCRIQIERDINTDYSRLVKLFSSFRKGYILGSELWLKHELMYMIDSSIETVDKYFILDKFELGNFVGLMNFVSRFDSGSTLQQHGFKVTQIKVKFLHDYKRLELYFVVGESHLKVKKRSAKSHRLYKLTIHYNAFHSVIVSRRDGFVAYFRMLQAPLIYAVEQDEEDESYISYQDLHSGTGWFRAVDLFKRCPSNMKKEFSMNTVLGLNFATENYDLLVQLVNHNKNMKVYFAPVNVVSSENSVPLFHINNFECFYAFQCLLSRSFEAADQLILRKELDQFKSFVLEKSEENSEALSEALYQLYYSFNKGNVVILMHSLPILYDKFVNQISLVTTQNKGNLINTENQQNNLLLIKRAICMPTHVMFLPPQPTLKSRALRSCNPDFSLRISIRDTNLETINMTLAHGPVANKKVQLREFFKEHFKTPLLKGIKVGKRCYNYVGSSTSQLRAHGLWFYACDNEGRTADKIRKEFGDIDKIKQVPKFMARMGQTFSQAMVNITVPQEYTNVDCPEDDVKWGIVKYLTDNLDIEEDRPEKFLVELSVNEREESKEEVEQYTFSDGVGRISLEIAEEVYKKLDIEDKKPSAMQIRYAGCKGMLVIDPRLEGKKIFFRESMKKFSSKNDSLEILKLSEKRTAYLNRPLITILEQLGIEKEVFLKLQKKMIQNHIKSMFHETEAWCFLHRNSLLRLDFLKLHISGIRFTEDPLFRSMIYALFRKQIELLKTKANIEIPVDQGRVMFGVMDETFTLEYGQVFVQYSDWDTDEPRILEGTVVVTKNPCMHPGDVRKFEAVDVEALHHIRDCIVFPAKGHRPHPDEMAGSDLDGDEYHVMWLKDLIFPSDNKEPMHYAVRKDKTQDRKTPITPADELDHLCEYIMNDKVGLVANAHLAFADYLNEGIFSKTCLHIAKLYSLCLDFPKSGKAVPNTKDVKVSKYPDFMEKLQQKDSYLSKKALGFLYRNCKRLELGLENEKHEIDYRLDQDLKHQSWKNYEKNAVRMLKKYSRKIEHLLQIYSFENEGELLSGAILNPPHHLENRHDLNNLVALLEFEIPRMFRSFQNQFFSEFGGKPKDNFTDKMFQKASAWYMVTYSSSTKNSSHFFGLPWAVADVLIALKIKNKKCSQEEYKKYNSKSLLEEIVDKSVAKHLPELTENCEDLYIYEARYDLLDVAYNILKKWLENQKEYFSDYDLKEFQKYISKEFGVVTSELLNCDVSYIKRLKKRKDIKKAISPCYYVIEALLKISEKGSQCFENTCSITQQELALVSWITLIKLACTYNPQYLGIPDEKGHYADMVFYSPQDGIIDTIQLPLFDKHNKQNMKFSKKIVQDETAVIDYLKQQTNLREITYRYVRLNDARYYVKFTVKGTRFAIEKLKDIVVLDNFYQSVIKNSEL